MQAFAEPWQQVQMFALPVAHKFVALTDLDGGENADQTLRYAIRLGDLAGDLLFVGDVRRQIADWPAGPPRGLL